MRVFAALDDFSRRSVALEFDVARPAERVTRMLDQVIEYFGKPRRIRSDNGPEVTSKVFDAWAYERWSGQRSQGWASIPQTLTGHRLDASNPGPLPP